MTTSGEIKPNTRYRVKTHNGLGKEVYGHATSDAQGRIPYVEIKNGNGSVMKIHPQWYKIIREIPDAAKADKNQIIESACILLPLKKGEAIYLFRGDAIKGRDGCQPSNSTCLMTFEIQETINAANSEYPSVQAAIEAGIDDNQYTEEVALALGFPNAEAAKKHEEWINRNAPPEYKEWLASIPGATGEVE
jgi:hypothetical protein